jgi:hypothetical protein
LLWKNFSTASKTLMSGCRMFAVTSMIRRSGPLCAGG